MELVGERLAIVRCESDVAAFKRLAGCEIGCGVFGVGAELAAAEGFVGVVDAGEEVSEVDAGVITARHSDEAASIGDDCAAVSSTDPKLVESLSSSLGGRPAQVLVRVAFDHREKAFTALQRVLGFDFASKARLGGACVAFEHLNAVVDSLSRIPER